jgi:hypothetical protein
LGYSFAAALYLASGIARGFIRPKSTFSDADDLAARMRAGSYEASIALSAGLTGLAVASQALGVWLSAGLAIEAEVVYLAGVFLDLGFLRCLGNLGFFFSFARLVTNDVASQRVLSTASLRPIYTWTPAALFHAIFFYINRLLR